MRVMYLPPYSPDYNPIELAFSAIKAFNIDNTYVYLHLYDATFSITPEDALGFYHHCGYI
ncbi:hypothetical protein BV22DRAFT_990349, partial [Leucogyrophana mollusca]